MTDDIYFWKFDSPVSHEDAGKHFIWYVVNIDGHIEVTWGRRSSGQQIIMRGGKGLLIY